MTTDTGPRADHVAAVAGPARPLPPREGAVVAAVSFDIWGTLVRSHRSFKAHRNEMLQEVLGLSIDPLRFDAELRRADREADLRSEESGSDLALADRLAPALVSLGVQGVELGPDLVADLERRQHDLALEMPPELLDERLPDLLRRLADLVPVGVTSNTGMLPGSTMRPLLAACDLAGALSVEVFSNEVGVAKPAAGIFRRTVEGFGVPAEGIVHVGDNPVADVDGARAAGLDVLLVAGDVPIGPAVEGLVARAREGRQG